MDSDKGIPGFPHPNPTTSYWQLPPHKIANHRTTESLPIDRHFDYIIIGSGISGAAIAYKLLTRDASLSILMLEARTAASGASGRNGGHCRAGWWLNYLRYRDSIGEDEALKFARLEEDNVQDVAEFVREHNVECEFVRVETADAYFTGERWAKVLTTIQARDEVKQRRPNDTPSIERKILQGKEAQDHMGMPGLVGAVVWPGYTQNPYHLVCRMLELSLDKGLNLQTNTMALEIISNGTNNWSVRTDRGTVHGTRIVLATNGYTSALHPSLAATEFLIPARSQATAIQPSYGMPKDPTALLRGSAGLNDAGSGDYYMFRSQLRHIIYGGGRSQSETHERDTTDDSIVHAGIATYLHGAPAQFFDKNSRGDDAGRVIRDWCGITCYTPDTFPVVGETPGQEGLWMSVAMNGHGMAMAFRSAEALVEMMITGKEPEWFPKSFRCRRAWDK